MLGHDGGQWQLGIQLVRRLVFCKSPEDEANSVFRQATKAVEPMMSRPAVTPGSQRVFPVREPYRWGSVQAGRKTRLLGNDGSPWFD